MHREKGRGEADERRHAGGILPIPLAVLVEDVDFGRLKPNASIDLDDTAGPRVGTRHTSYTAALWLVTGCLNRCPHIGFAGPSLE